MTLRRLSHLPLLAPLLFMAVPGMAQNNACVNQINGRDCKEGNMNTITTAVPFLMISVDSRAGGMGDAGVAVSPDANSIHWNPSKLAFAEKEGEFSISYSPWLRKLVPDMSLAYIAGYKKLSNDRSAIGGSLRYFNLGSITFTDINGSTIREFKPAEFAIDVAFAQKFSDNFSGGIAIRYINSNLTGGISVQGANSKAGQSVAADVSFFYQKPELQIGEKDATFAFGLNVSNVGAKMSYTSSANKDFIPINLRLGPAFTVNLDEYNSLTVNLDANKLLVPTPPIYDPKQRDPATGEFLVASGRNPNVGVAEGIFGSFSDAPGFGEWNADSSAFTVYEGSKRREELQEINLAGGLEYWYDKQFAFRAGYFHEHFNKGNRQYFTVGLGLRYSKFALDMSYLIANQQRSPLANTLRFTLGFVFDGKGSKKKAG
ncbi:MAG: type IX secretion system outer membrane channel protein PorV [Flavobacteriales bacterium]|nr:type IX secretion system outer membrane channel protein PorV [Flavobacteriales bacterium]